MTNAYAVAVQGICRQMSDTSYCDGMFPMQFTGVSTSVDGSVSMPGCSTMVAQCWETTQGMYSPWYTCNVCASGYKRTKTSATMMGCGSTYYYYCEQDCTGCSDCTSDTSWSSAGTGYDKKVTRTCNCNTCNSSTSYRCAAGYYGSSSNGTSGCSKCTSHNSVSANSSAGSTAQTSCYISSSSSWSFSDTTGSGSAKFASNCYYSN